MLGEQLKILSELELDFDLEAIGFEVPEIDLLIDGLNVVPDADPDDRLPEVSESATTVSGDLWQLGKHRVLCGNSLIASDYDRLMDGGKTDLVISDPPYNVAIDGHATGLGNDKQSSSISALASIDCPCFGKLDVISSGAGQWLVNSLDRAGRLAPQSLPRFGL